MGLLENVDDSIEPNTKVQKIYVENNIKYYAVYKRHKLLTVT